MDEQMSIKGIINTIGSVIRTDVVIDNELVLNVSTLKMDNMYNNGIINRSDVDIDELEELFNSIIRDLRS